MDRKGCGGGAGLPSASGAKGAASMTPVLVLVLRSPCALSAPRWTNYNNERKRNIKASIEAYYFFQQYTFLFVDNLHSLKKEEITCVDRTGGWGWGWVGRGS